uniref:Estradiol 17-beta-dehydrogenase 11 n=1 Tax=Strix occidentalis caurina TaxID=311401 RepID=A0A8D0FXI0_STROC
MNPFLELLLFLATLIYSYLEAFVKLFVPVKRKSVSGELVLITGAGHGVGRATAFEFAKRHSRLVLWDINKHGVEDTAAECERLGATVQAFVVDCSKREEIYSAAEKVGEQGHKTVFLPSHFCFFPSCSSSKFAAVGFHKALTEELSTLGKDGVKTTCLCPVFINTGFVKNPSTRLGKILEVEEVVEALMEGILTNQKMVFVPSHLSIALNWIMCNCLPERILFSTEPPI